MVTPFPLRRALPSTLTSLLVVALAVPALSGAPAEHPTAAVDPALREVGGGAVAVVVRKANAGDRAPERAVERLGGRVTRLLPIVDGFAATVPAGKLAALAAADGVRVVSLDREVRVQGTSQDSPPPPATVKSVHPVAVRADEAHRAGVDGTGITVAVVDTGIADVPDLAGRVLPVVDDATGRTESCKNLSGEEGCGDSYGHGTFMAGLIAGSGGASGGAYAGVAPGAKLLSVKIAGSDGSADVSNVLSAIQWVVSFRDRYRIRVLNLSLGTDSTQSHRVDPLNYAVERAWAAGIVVVVSAANLGPGPGTIAKPGDDPYVVTVGAVDDRETPGISDDQLPNFSSRGPTAADGLAKPDVVAPGGRLVSLRAPGSAVEDRFPAGVDATYRRGSGTSMATAVASGVAALVLQANPTMTPDRVKHVLRATARPVASTDPFAVGSGMVDAYAAALAPPVGSANQGLSRSTGTGSIDASRGTVRVRLDDPTSTVLTGALTAQLLLWDPVGYATGEWSESAFYASTWSVNRFYRTTWYGSNWQGSNWQGSTFYGQPSPNFYGSNWQGSAWYGAWG